VGNLVLLERAVAHAGATVTGVGPLSVITPRQPWAHAVSIPVSWAGSAARMRDRDGAIRLRVRIVDGRVIVRAVDSNGAVIDQMLAESPPELVDIDLVSVPLAACDSVIVANARTDWQASRVDIVAADCIDFGHSPDGELSAPPQLTLRPVDDWWLYYGVGRSLADRLRSARYARLDRPERMPWLENLSVNVYPNDDLSRVLYISGLYEPLTALVLQRLLVPGATFIDVGANAGLFSMLASRWVGDGGRVYAFEPSEREFRRLLDHITLNRLRNVTALRQAVGERSGIASLRVAEYPNAGHNTLAPSFRYPNVATARVEATEILTLDRFVELYRPERIDAVKIDIEGHECAALSGASSLLTRFRPVVISELSDDGMNGQTGSPGTIRLLKTARYAIYRIGRRAELIPLEAGKPGQDGNIVAVPLERPPV
jgi:FkbM family methyltransferase